MGPPPAPSPRKLGQGTLPAWAPHRPPRLASSAREPCRRGPPTGPLASQARAGNPAGVGPPPAPSPRKLGQGTLPAWAPHRPPRLASSGREPCRRGPPTGPLASQARAGNPAGVGPPPAPSPRKLGQGTLPAWAPHRPPRLTSSAREPCRRGPPTALLNPSKRRLRSSRWALGRRGAAAGLPHPECGGEGAVLRLLAAAGADEGGDGGLRHVPHGLFHRGERGPAELGFGRAVEG
ncbi:hypothetical protein NKCBBBOE_03385 [Pseudarthrobacter sp. MM222]|nr:hypothetical protein NKCBBBOE_03385 [Pseudarthrobacter sp. MM222]